LFATSYGEIKYILDY